MKFDYFLRMAVILVSGSLTACGGGGGGTVTSNCTLGTGATLKVSGAITFDRVPLFTSGPKTGALDFANTSQEPSTGILVEAVCGSTIVTSASSDDSGLYTLSVPAGTQGVIVRAKARMLKTGTPSWDVEVKDESQSVDLIFSMDSTPFNVEASNVTKNLHAPSGFDGSSYASARVAGPFAILDTIDKSMKLVLTANPSAVFPALDVRWSASSNTGTFYTSNVISILGRTTDTDEYDEHVVAHEWGHYFQDAFSRDDSIGGRHSSGDILDIRVAFSEGFGNAFSAMVLGDPVYKDSQSIALEQGFSIDVESNSCVNEGWYNECSVQSVLYDFFDTDNEPSDVFSFGFDEIHEVMTSSMPLSDAFTSIFSFINPFKNLSTVDEADTDTFLALQSIDPITDNFGTGVSKGLYSGVTDIIPVYDAFAPSTVNICNTAENGPFNGLGVTRYIAFTAASTGPVTFVASRDSGVAQSDPDMYLYFKGNIIAAGESFNVNTENFTASLVAGQQYVLEVLEFSYTDVDYDPSATGAINETCFIVTRS